MIDRRSFLKSLAAITASLHLPGCSSGNRESGQGDDRLGSLLPQRKLGGAEEAVTMLGVGGWHIGRMSERDAQETLEAALEGGVRFFDSAESYQDGGSEERLGKLLIPRYRDHIFLMTKTLARDAKTVRRHLEESLRRLQTDHLDLWQIHSLQSPQDVDERLSAGVLEAVKQLQAEGKARYIGFTGHRTPDAHLRMLEKADGLQTCQMPLNLADVSYNSFIQNVLPRLVDRKIGVLAMKTLANGGFFGGSRHGEHGNNPRLVPNRVSVAEAIHFVWSLPVSVLITGPDNPAQMKEKIQLARSFTALTESQRTTLVSKVADLAGRRVEFYKA